MNNKYLCLSILFLVFFLCFPDIGYAQKRSRPILWGYVSNIFTRGPIKNATVYMLSSDGTVVDSAKSSMRFNGRNGAFQFRIDTAGVYMFRIVHPDYKEKTFTHIIRKIRKHDSYLQIPVVYLQRKFNQIAENTDTLGEVNVVATKVKFYYRGDTLVYSADAFNVTEGSMLDDLIRQLPGAELKDNGQIFVNGRLVESLLLNGKDFVGKDNNLMLENLPYYMVNELKVYERQLPMMFERETFEKQYVMDVSLKRRYVTGWIANAEGGYGTSDRYMGRLFGLRMTTNSQIFLYANINNLNYNAKPGNTGDWTPLSLGYGESTNRVAGLNYNINDGYNKFELKGYLNVSHSDGSSSSRTNRTNFLSGGDTYENSFTRTRNCSWNVETEHNMQFRSDSPYGIIVVPYFRYNKYNSHGEFASALFSEDMTDFFGKDMLDSISSPDPEGVFMRKAINRLLTSSFGNGHELNTRINVNHKYQPYSNIILTLFTSYAYSDSKRETFDHYRLDYINYQSTNPDHRNRYDDRFIRSHNFLAGLQATIHLDTETNIAPSYRFTGSLNENNRSLYLLNLLDGWGVDTGHPLGSLPSMSELLSVVDNDNSMQSDRFEQKHSFNLNFNKSISGETKYWWINVDLPLNIYIKDLDYSCGGSLYTPHKGKVFIEPVFNMNVNSGNLWNLSLNYSGRGTIPDLINYISVRDDSNPLNVFIGNQSLKTGYVHSLDAGFRRNLSRQRMYNVGISAGLSNNSLSMGYVYDRTTGVKTITPCTVNGNWNVGMRGGYSCPLGKTQGFTFSTNSSVEYWKSVDMIGVDDGLSQFVEAEKTGNGNLYVNETARINYRPSSKYDIGLRCNFHYLNSNSDRKELYKLDAFDFDYGFTAKIELPLEFQLSTDLTMYSRRGYTDKSMNTDDLVWNARLSKRFLKGNLVVMLDGFDMLDNLSGIYRKVDSSGRVESFYARTHHYALLHVVYKFNEKK